MIQTKPTEHDVLVRMREVLEQSLLAAGAVQREVSRDFARAPLKLRLPLPLVFGARRLQIHFDSYSAPHLEVASYSQFEAPPGSGRYVDLAFQLRPGLALAAPLLHGEILRPMAGSKGMFVADLYNVNPWDVDAGTFVREHCPAWRQALERVEPYQKTAAQGRGKLTRHLEPFKSPYRIELREPPRKSPAYEAYFEAVFEAFALVVDGYIEALTRLSSADDPAVSTRNQAGVTRLMETLYHKDFAVRLGRFLLRRDFDAYFQDGFWGASRPAARPSGGALKRIFNVSQG